MRFLRTFIKTIDQVNRWLALAGSVLMPAMVVAISIEVVCRYVFGKPTVWAFDIAIFTFGYCGLLAGPYVLKLKEHINVDIIYARLSPRAQAILDSITGPLIFFFLVLVITYCWGYAMSSLRLHERTATEWGPPVGHYKLMIPIGATLLLLQGIANWIRSLYRAITDKELDA